MLKVSTVIVTASDTISGCLSTGPLAPPASLLGFYITKMTILSSLIWARLPGFRAVHREAEPDSGSELFLTILAGCLAEARPRGARAKTEVGSHGTHCDWCPCKCVMMRL